MPFSQLEIMQNHARLQERDDVVRSFGYDFEEATHFVLSKALPLAGRVLEIGTGKGRFLTALLRHVPLVTTVDLDASEQRFARLNIAFDKPDGKVRFVVADAEKLPWGESAFDSVVSVNALHHMKNLYRIVDELLRILTPEGKIVLADLSDEGLAIFETVHLREGRTHERTKYRFEDLMKHFTARGWSAVLSHGDRQVVLLATKQPAR
jgi:ubiquinone/menaquinone biosynthesis C-methylase UbiE